VKVVLKKCKGLFADIPRILWTNALPAAQSATGSFFFANSQFFQCSVHSRGAKSDHYQFTFLDSVALLDIISLETPPDAGEVKIVPLLNDRFHIDSVPHRNAKCHIDALFEF
jgi:hypothetical protein